MSGECEKHTDCMERIHADINDIKLEQSNTKGMIEGFTNSINEFVASIRKDVYSPGGMVEKVGSHTTQIGLQWGLLVAIVLMVILEWIIKK